MKRTYTVLVLAAMMGTATCADFTEHPVTGVASEYFQSEAGANAAVLGTYAFLRSFYGGEFEVLMTDVGTDSWEKGEQLTANGFWNDYTPQLSPSEASAMLLPRWQNAYAAINAANTAIASIGAAQGLDATTKNTRLGEARFLRALYYSMLVKTWGAVQLNLEPTVRVV